LLPLRLLLLLGSKILLKRKPTFNRMQRPEPLAAHGNSVNPHVPVRPSD
jgi:hypothetical protein